MLKKFLSRVNNLSSYHSDSLFIRNRRCMSQFPVTGSFSIDNNFIVSVGSYIELKHTFTQEDVNQFSQLMGDNNPIHINPIYAEGTIFKGTIVHGIFVSSLFSTIFGRSIPGSIYVNQNVNFKKPVHVGAEVTARIEVVNIENKKKGNLMTCSTKCFLSSDGSLVIDGDAKVLLMNKLI